MNANDQGRVVQEFPRTLSFKNWPFLILLLLLGGCPAGLMVAGGNIAGGSLVFATILCIPVLILAGPYLIERLGLIVRVVSLHENGLRTSFGGKHVFWSWAQLTLKKDFVSGRARGIRQRVQMLEAASPKKSIVLQAGLHGDAAMDFVASRLGAVARGMGSVVLIVVALSSFVPALTACGGLSAKAKGPDSTTVASASGTASPAGTAPTQPAPAGAEASAAPQDGAGDLPPAFVSSVAPYGNLLQKMKDAATNNAKSCAKLVKALEALMSDAGNVKIVVAYNTEYAKLSPMIQGSVERRYQPVIDLTTAIEALVATTAEACEQDAKRRQDISLKTLKFVMLGAPKPSP